MTRAEGFPAASVAALSLLIAAPAAAQAPRVFHVDHQAGDDTADGLSPATAWKHAPGDARSTGVARLLVLQPGDVVRFRAGVRYRGSFTPRAQGTAEAPVILEGGSPGGLGAIIDGSEPLANVRRCTSAADCLGNPAWASLWRADLPATARFDDWLFVNDRPLQMAQYPALPAESADDPSRYAAVPRAQLAPLLAGTILHPLPPAYGEGLPVLALWVQPNQLAYTTDVRVSAGGLSFAGAQWQNASFKPYPDRDNRFSLLNVPALVNRPGLFALSPGDGVALFWPPAGGTPRVSTGGRRLGINLARAGYTVVRGFSFVNFAGREAGKQAGSAILANGKAPGIAIRDNSFASFVNITSSSAAVHTLGQQGLDIARNRLAAMPFTAGIIVDNTRGGVTVRCNSLADIGRTGIRFNNVANGEIRGNSLTRINGPHGNGISAYNDSRNVLIADNVVTASARPLTVHGASTPFHDEAAGTPAVTVRNNVLISTNAAGGALTSYGRTPNFRVEGNFLAAPRFALKLAGSESGFSATDNRLVGSVSVSNRAPMFDAGANQMHDPEGNGVQLVADMAGARAPAGACGPLT
jgi:hypothetical protein